MKLVTNLLAVLVMFGVAGLTGIASAADKGAAKGLRGSVVKVDGDKLTIKSGKKGEEKEVVVATNADTKVVIEGKDAKLADLKEGQRVSVTPAEGTATHIEVMVPKPKAAAPAPAAK